MARKPDCDEINLLHARLCHALSDPRRIALLYELEDGPQNVTDLVVSLQLPQSSVSRHLRVLRDQGLVKAQRNGKMVFYRLTDSRVIEALDLLRGVLIGQFQPPGTRSGLLTDPT